MHCTSNGTFAIEVTLPDCLLAFRSKEMETIMHEGQQLISSHIYPNLRDAIFDGAPFAGSEIHAHIDFQINGDDFAIDLRATLNYDVTGYLGADLLGVKSVAVLLKEFVELHFDPSSNDVMDRARYTTLRAALAPLDRKSKQPMLVN